MYFYDGCALVGDLTRCKVVSWYTNGDAMVIIQGRIGIIGCHPESMPDWYDKPCIKPRWLGKSTPKMLRVFPVNIIRAKEKTYSYWDAF